MRPQRKPAIHRRHRRTLGGGASTWLSRAWSRDGDERDLVLIAERAALGFECLTSDDEEVAEESAMVAAKMINS